MDLSGAVAIVTGGAIRVGRAITEALAREGARVAVHYYESHGEAESVVRSITDAGGDAKSFQGDMKDPDTPAELVASVTRELGLPTVLVNSAAIMEATPLQDFDVERWDRIMAINLRAPWLMSVAVAESMRKSGSSGVIVNISDLAAFESWPDYPVHSISKAGVVAMTRSLARILAPTVRVNCIAPGAVLLPEGWSEESAARVVKSTPLQRLGSAADVAEAVVYLARADYVTGETIFVDGGRSVRH